MSVRSDSLTPPLEPMDLDPDSLELVMGSLHMPTTIPSFRMDNIASSFKGNITLVPKHRISVEDHSSFFKYQHEQFLSESRNGRITNINFVSKSGVVVSAHQAILLPHSSYLQTLVDAGESCGCSEGVPTLLLPDWHHEVIQALVNLLYSGSAIVSGAVKDELIQLMRELRCEVLDELVTVPSLPSSDKNENEETLAAVPPTLPSFGQIEEEETLASVPPTLSSDQNEDQEILVPDTLLAPAPPAQISSSNEDNGIEEMVSSTKRIKVKHEETKEINDKQESLIEKLNYVLSLLERVNIKNDQLFAKMIKPLGDLLSCLKYVPVKPHFDILPTEIKRDILSYLCDSGTILAATVCSEWKDNVNSRLIKLKKVIIGKHCSNVYSCEEGKCFMPGEMLVAANILRLNVPLTLCSPVTNLDPKLIADGLTNVSHFSINNKCTICRRENENIQDNPVLTAIQMELLFETLEEKCDTVNNVALFSLNMTHMDQDKLTKCLLKIERLTLHHNVGEPFMDVQKFIQKLLDNSIESKLKALSMVYLEYPDNLSVALADALCQIPGVSLSSYYRLTLVALQRFIRNILTRTIRMKYLIIKIKIDWRTLMSPEDLKVLMSKLKKIVLCGRFTSEQMEAARLLPGVNVNDGESVISKGVAKDYINSLIAITYPHMIV